MESNRKTAGALIGAFGAQLLVVGAFYIFGQRCCFDMACINDDSRCLFGLELFSYWASVGSVATVLAAVTGAVVAGD